MSPENPLKKTQAVREELKHAVDHNMPFLLTVESETSSFLLGLPLTSMEKLIGRSLIIEGEEGRQTFSLDTTAENAKKLFVSWSENADPELQKSFVNYAYDHLWAFVQAGHINKASRLAKGAHGLILDALADTGKSQYRFLEGMRTRVETTGEIEEGDKEAFATLLTTLWEKMDNLDRANRFEPRLAFQGR